MTRTGIPRAHRAAPARRIGVVAALAAAASAALLLAGCSGSTGSAPSKSPSSTQKASAIAGVWGDSAKAAAPYFDFDDDGSVAGTDGCNRISGSWKLNGGTIELGELVSTRMACSGVDTWLSGASTATVSGKTMTVMDEKGTQIGTLARADADAKDPVDEDFLGSWGSTEARKPGLAITADGRFTGNDGCNGLSGSWTAKGDDEIVFSETASTLMACPDVDTKLGLLASAKVSDGTLTVLDAKGAEIAKLERSRG